MAKKKRKANPDGPAVGPWIVPAPDKENSGLPTTQDAGRLLERAAGKLGGDMDAAVSMYRALFTQYTDALIANHGALTRQAMDDMDVIDLRGVLPYPEDAADPGATIPDVYDSLWFSTPLESFPTQTERFYALLPCFQEGLIRINHRRWLHFVVRDLDLDALTAVIHVTDYMQAEFNGADLVTMGRGATVRLAPPFDWDVRDMTDARLAVMNGKDDPLGAVDVTSCFGHRVIDKADFIQLYTLIPARKLGWTKRQARLWEAVTVQNAVNQQARFAAVGIDPELAVANQFLYYVLLSNKYLDMQRSRVMSDEEVAATCRLMGDPPPKPAPEPLDPDVPIRRMRTVDNVRFISVKSPRRPSRGNVMRQYRRASWPARGHVRHYKSGKTVYIKPTVKHRKALKGKPAPKVSTTIKLKEAHTVSKPLDQETFESLVSARDALCEYCGATGTACEDCRVTDVMAQAIQEARDTGILEEDRG